MSSAEPRCEDDLCPNGFTCDPATDLCAESCDGIDGQPCQNGWECIGSECVSFCEDGDCPDHLGCSSETTCRTICSSNDHCASGYACCTDTKQSNGKCDVSVGDCF